MEFDETFTDTLLHESIVHLLFCFSIWMLKSLLGYPKWFTGEGCGDITKWRLLTVFPVYIRLKALPMRNTNNNSVDDAPPCCYGLYLDQQGFPKHMQAYLEHPASTCSNNSELFNPFSREQFWAIHALGLLLKKIYSGCHLLFIPIITNYEEVYVLSFQALYFIRDVMNRTGNKEVLARYVYNVSYQIHFIYQERFVKNAF